MKNIIFDIGGVILKGKSNSILDKLNLSPEEYNEYIRFFDGFLKLDLGTQTIEERYNECHFTSDKYKEVLLNYYRYRELNNDIINLIKILKGNNYKTYLLSDNNKTVFNYILNKIDDIDGWVVSCDYGTIKEEGELFNYLLVKYSLKPEECFFIDDKEVNVNKALEYGINGCLFDENNDFNKLLDVLNDNGIKTKVDVNYEYIDPFDLKYNYLLRVEHLGRYLFAGQLLKGYDSVLDVACANGYGSYVLSKSVNKVLGIDKDYIDEKYKRDNIEFLKLDLNNNKIEGKYNAIVCFETIEHLLNPDMFLDNLYNILDDKGILILSVPNSLYEINEKGELNDKYHVNVFKVEEIIRMFKKHKFYVKDVYGQSYINKIVNKEIKDYKTTTLDEDARGIGYPNKEELNKSYSYIFILNK